eukprot:g12636.t1
MTQTGVDGVGRQASAVAPGHSGPPPPVISNEQAENSGGGVLAQALGTLGLLEVWIFIVYVNGEYRDFTRFEQVILGTLMLAELLGRIPGMLALCLALNCQGPTSSSTDGPDNLKTMTRDQLHNVVYPRSPPRSRKRRDFAALAWYSLLVTVIPVVLLLSFYPAWGPEFDEPLWIRVVPSVLAGLAVVEGAAGSACLDSNHSSYVLTLMYAHAKLVSLFVLVCGADRLLLGEGEGGGVVLLGIPLACLQAIKIISALVAAVNYLRGRPDEDLPTLEDVSRKKTDEMKKRAIHTAANYDEFRHMVSCAQLTPVTRKEMEMLSDQKRGWQGRSGGVAPVTKKPGSHGRDKTPRGTRKCDGAEIRESAKSTGPVRAPRDYSQFQRDWRRRCRTDDERREYLRMISPDKLPVLFRVELEPDILGQVLLLICHDFTGHPVGDKIDSAKAPTHQPGDGNASSTFGSSPGSNGGSLLGEDEARYCVEWLSALSKTGRFAVNILFLEEKEKLALGRLFDLITAACNGSSDEDSGKILSLRKAYAV